MVNIIVFDPKGWALFRSFKAVKEKLDTRRGSNSELEIYLHWITLLFVAITYAAMELRGWFPKGSSTYLLMRETHYNAGIFVWVLMFSRLIIKHRYSDPSIVPPPPAWQMKAASLMHIMLYPRRTYPSARFSYLYDAWITPDI